jgi:hypothetical protein
MSAPLFNNGDVIAYSSSYYDRPGKRLPIYYGVITSANTTHAGSYDKIVWEYMVTSLNHHDTVFNDLDYDSAAARGAGYYSSAFDMIKLISS